MFNHFDLYSLTAFNIYEKPECFICIIASYVMMSDEKLGFDTFIKQNNGNQFITIMKNIIGKERKLQLNLALIAYQWVIVCCGTACFHAKTSSFKNFQYIIKFSWVSDKQWLKADLLRLMHKRGVEGVTRLFGHHQITSIVDMREGLTFGKPYAFWSTTLSPASSFSQSQSLLPQSFGQICSLGTTGDLPKKRKSVDAGGSPSKRSRSNS